MANITAKDVAALRERTGVGMMDCKKALVEANGDFEAAIVLLREKGLATQAKKAGRVAAEGLVIAMVDGNVGCVVEVNSETDFVANTDQFKNFVNLVAKTVLACNPADVEALKACKAVGSDKTVEEELQFKNTVRRSRILAGGDTADSRFVHAYVIGNLFEYQRSQPGDTILEERLLMTDNAFHDPVQRALTLVKTFDQPRRRTYLFSTIFFFLLGTLLHIQLRKS